MYVVIGKFSPFHKGHKQLIDKLLEIGDVMILIGSVNKINHRNFLTYKEKMDIIEYNGYCYIRNGKITVIAGLYDFEDNNQWVEQVVDIIENEKTDKEIIVVTGNPYIESLLCPHYKIVHPQDVIGKDNIIPINASACRHELANCKDDTKKINGLSGETFRYLTDYGIIKRMKDTYDKKLYEKDLRDNVFESLDAEKNKRGN
jgi:cytidyltransferase-like protein